MRRRADDAHIIPQVEQAMFSMSFAGEIPLAILFPSAALSLSPCVHRRSIVRAEERTPLRSSPILRLQAPLTPQHALQKKKKNDIDLTKSFTPTRAFEVKNWVIRWLDMFPKFARGGGNYRKLSICKYCNYLRIFKGNYHILSNKWHLFPNTEPVRHDGTNRTLINKSSHSFLQNSCRNVRFEP